MKPLRPGTRGIIVAGPFHDIRQATGAKVIEDRGDRIEVEIEVAGRSYAVSLERGELRPERRAKDPTPFIWAEIQQAVRRRVGFDLECDAWWAARLGRREAAFTDEELTAMLQAFRPVERALEARIAEELGAIESRFHQRFDGLRPAEKRRAWREERAVWIEARVERTKIEERLSAEVPDFIARRGEAQLALMRAELATRQRRRARHPLGEPDPRTTPIATAPEIEAAIDLDPDAVEPYLVYADLLQSAGDPRGELIVLQSSDERRRADVAAAEQRHLSTNEEYLLGALAEHPKAVELEWSRGFIESAALRRTDEPELVLATLLALPSARYLRALSVEGFYEDEREAILEALIRFRPRHLSRLRIGPEGDPETSDWSELDAGDLSELLAAFPDLVELAVRAARVGLGAAPLSKLRSLELETLALSHDNLAALTSKSWPALERVDLWFGATSMGASLHAEDLAPLLSGRALPRLRSLALQNVEFADDLCARMLGAAVLPRLDRLDLAMGTMSDEGAETLCFGAKLFKNLRLLDVRENYLGMGARKKLAKLAGPTGPVLIDRPQRKTEDWDIVGPIRTVLIDYDQPM